jgi:hypothetical protein
LESKSENQIEKTAEACAILEFSSLGIGLMHMNQMMARDEMQVLEMIQTGRGLTLLVLGGREALDELLGTLPSDDRRRNWLVTPYRPQVLRCLASLDQSPVERNLLVLESEEPGFLLQCAHQALAAGIGIVDFKIPRGALPWGHLLLTDRNEKKLETLTASIQPGNSFHRISMIANVDPAFAKYFDLVP